jgi:histidine ammonia-lyase
MLDRISARKPTIFLCALTMTWALVATPTLAFEAAQIYQPITETAAGKTIKLTGRDLTIEQVVDIARNGAKVELSAEALQRSADAYGLLLQGAAEGVTIYWFNRGAGDQRETVIFSGDPTTPENTKLLKDQQLARFKSGVTRGYGPEMDDEALVRAIMAIRANAYAQAQTVLLVEDARKLLEWTDLSYAMGLNGMNSSVTPISVPVQSMRPYEWLTWDAARIMDMIKGSYLFDEDPARIIQDPESMRASSQRQGSAWQSWAELRDSVLLSINSSDHNPAVLPGLTPESSWELSTPQFMKYYIKGGPLSNGKSGYIFSNANWDPYPMANQVEAFTIALTNMGVAVAQRIERFRNPFFTVIKPADVLNADERKDIPTFDGYLATDLWQELAGMGTPVTPAGQAIVATVEDLEAQTRIKTARARQAVDLSFHLLAQDLLTASYWMELRKAQDPDRKFGEAPTVALKELRQVIPWRQPAAERQKRPLGVVAYEFMQDNPASKFYQGGPQAPKSATAPTAGVLPN